jgi:hypothetical protein
MRNTVREQHGMITGQEDGDSYTWYWAVIPRSQFPDAPTMDLVDQVRDYAENSGLVSSPYSGGPGRRFAHQASVRFGRNRILLRQAAGWDI